MKYTCIQWPKDGATITDTKSLDKVVEDDVNIFDTVDECEIAGVMLPGVCQL